MGAITFSHIGFHVRDIEKMALNAIKYPVEASTLRRT